MDFHPSVLPGVPPPPKPSEPRRRKDRSEVPEEEVDPRHVLVTGVNLRVTEAYRLGQTKTKRVEMFRSMSLSCGQEQLKDFLEAKLTQARW